MAYEDRLALDLVLDAVAVSDGGHLPAAVEVRSEIIDGVADGYDGRAVVRGLAEVGITATGTTRDRATDDVTSHATIATMSSVSLRQMTDNEFVSWQDRSMRAYAEERATAHGRSLQDAMLAAKEETERLLPDGRMTCDHFFFRILDQEEPVGWVWVGPQADNTGAMWIYDIEVEESAQSRGIGRQAMLAAEEFARSRGAHEVGLNVFGHNPRAISLYQSLGYSTVAMRMRKPIPDE